MTDDEFKVVIEGMVREGVGDKEITAPYMSMMSMALVHLQYADHGAQEAMVILEDLCPEFAQMIEPNMRAVHSAQMAIHDFLVTLSRIGAEREHQQEMERT